MCMCVLLSLRISLCKTKIAINSNNEWLEIRRQNDFGLQIDIIRLFQELLVQFGLLSGHLLGNSCLLG